MTISRILATSVLGAVLSFAAHAQVEVSACAQQGLNQCKLSSASKGATSLSQYSRAFNCVKYGSTSGTKFNVGIPIPEVGQLGFDFGDHAEYSTDVCNEEVKKLDTASFFQNFGESFSSECGNHLGGMYQQCLGTLVELKKLEQGQAPQTLACQASQSPAGLVIAMRYRPGEKDSPKGYVVSKVTGPRGVVCEKNVSAGVNSPSLLNCTIPKDALAGDLVIRLKNSASCKVAMQPPVSSQIETARSNSCAGVFNALASGSGSGGGAQPFKTPLFRATAIGYCDMCLNANLNTGPADQRSLRTRLRSCAGWAIESLVSDGALVCELKGNPTNSGFPAPMPNPLAPNVAPPPGTELHVFAASLASTQAAALLCNQLPVSQVVKTVGSSLERIPKDFVAPSDSVNAEVRKLLEKLIDERP